MNKPVAYMCLDTSRLRAGHCADKVLRFNKPKQPHVVDIVPLYPKRKWVGLTDEEAAWCQAPTTTETWTRIEAKLKEKNT